MWELDFWKAGLGKVPNGCVNVSHVQSSQDAFEEVGMGSRRAGAWREKADEVELPSSLFPPIRCRLPLNGIKSSSNPLYLCSALLEKNYLTF